MINKQLNVRISPQLFDAIREAGANQNLSPSNYAIAALTYCVDNGISFLPGGVAPANDATQIDIVGTVNEILAEFRSDLTTQIEARLLEIEAKLELFAGSDTQGDDVPTEDAGDAGSCDGDQGEQATSVDEDWEVLNIIRAGRESDPPVTIEKIAKILIDKGLTVAGKSGKRIKPTRLNIGAIARANEIP